jgi:TetR/AcrR family transcriptional regulator, transcriptional repressor for nem operon
MVGVRQFDEERVLARAIEVFRKKSLRTASMQDLARATGVQRGSLYNAYGDKEELFLRAYERDSGPFLAAARTALASRDLRQALLGFLNLFIASISRGSPPCGCLTTKTAVDAPVVGRRVRERVRALLDELEIMVSEAMDREAARKCLVLTPQRAALVIVTFIRGLTVMERAYQDPSRLTQAAVGLVEALVRMPRRRKSRKAYRASLLLTA